MWAWWGKVNELVVFVQIIGNNPMFAGNPQLMEQFRAQLPAMMQQVGLASVFHTV